MKSKSNLCAVFIFVFQCHACSLIVGSKPQPLDADGVDAAEDVPAETDGFDVADDADVDVPVEVDVPGDVPSEPDAPYEPEIPPVFVWVSIPAGSFEMGCSLRDMECKSTEFPSHTVHVPAFEMTETEITQAQYEWVMGSNPSYFAACGASCPVDQVTWYEAKAFCEAIGGRLPSEAEWEYAARAGTTTRYYCGDDAACLDAIAWYEANSGSTTHPAGQKPANAFDLHDMLGNVWEWVEDCVHDDYTDAPSTGEVWSGGDCGYHVLRGGSWGDSDVYLRVSARSGDFLFWVNKYEGFRCARNF